MSSTVQGRDLRTWPGFEYFVQFEKKREKLGSGKDQALPNTCRDLSLLSFNAHQDEVKMGSLG